MWCLGVVGIPLGLANPKMDTPRSSIKSVSLIVKSQICKNPPRAAVIVAEWVPYLPKGIQSHGYVHYISHISGTYFVIGWR